MQRICFLWKTISQGNGCRTDNAIVESMFFKEIAERYFDSSNIKDKTAAADEVLRIYEILTVHQKRLVLQKILKKEDND